MRSALKYRLQAQIRSKQAEKNLELYYTKIFLFQLYFKSSEEFGYSYRIMPTTFGFTPVLKMPN